MRLRLLGMDADAKERNRQSPEHAQTDAGKRVPAQVYSSQTNRHRPEQSRGLENVEHELAFHNLSRF